jgi:predicted DNA-binding transcriptional regulator AlpA
MAADPGRPAVPRLLLTPDEVIEACGLRGRKQFYRMVDAGHIPVIRLGKVIRVPLRSLQCVINTLDARSQQRRRAS